MNTIMDALANYSEVLSLILGLLAATLWQLLRDRWNHKREEKSQLRSSRLELHAEFLTEVRLFRQDMTHLRGKGVDPDERRHRPFKENSRSVNGVAP